MMLKNGKKLIIGVFGLLALLFGAYFKGNSAYATSDVNIQKSIANKIRYQGVYKCYQGGAMVGELDLGDYEGVESLMGPNAGNDENFVKLASGVRSGWLDQLSNGRDSISCRQLFLGGGGKDVGIVEATVGKAPTNDGRGDSNEKVVTFLENMGYEVSSKGGGDLCVSASFMVYGVSAESKNKICQNSHKKLYTEGGTKPNPNGVSFKLKDDEICLVFLNSDTRCGEWGGGSLNQNSIAETIKTKICRDGGQEGICTFNGYGGSVSYIFDSTASKNPESESLSGRVATLADDKDGAARQAISFLSNESVQGNLAITKVETRILYQEYLTQYYDYEIDCANEHVGVDTIPWFDQASGEMKECYVVKTGDKTGKVHGVQGDGEDNFGKIDVDASDIISYLKDKENQEYTDDELEEMGAIASSDREDDVKDDCRNSNAGNSLGWVLCPILELAGSAVDGIYNDLIEPKLGVDPKLFNSESASGEQIPYFAWQQFRDIANMIFVILLLVVLFSQLTGVGIDNYGIKRVLPKLIISAVLINLSYLICVLVIDVSNIVGNGAAALFDNLGRNLPKTIILSTDSGAVGVTDATESLVTVGLAAGMATMVGSIWATGPLILVTLLPTILSALVAFLFLFLLLSARQAAVVVLVVLSPLAVACNILPNTKSFFDKYLKAFKLLILVYPIASVLISGGDYVSKLLLQIGGDGDNFGGDSGNFFLALTSMVVGIAPIFFIPSLIKDSFAALGKVGATISGLGRTVGNTASKAVQGSGFYKNSQMSSAERRARIKGGLDKNGNPVDGRRRVLANILSGGSMGRQRNALEYQQLVAKRGSLAAADEKDFMLRTETENELKRINSSGEIDNDVGMKNSLVRALLSNGSDSRAKIRAYTDALSVQGDSGRQKVKEAWDEAIRSGGISNDNARAFSSNLINNHGKEYKDNHRSMFEVARGALGGGLQTTDAYLNDVSNRNKLMTSAKADTMAEMDDDAFKETFFSNGAVSLAGLSQDDRIAVGKNAFSALRNNKRMNASRLAGLEAIYRASGYNPAADPAEANPVVIVNNGNNNGGGAGGGGANQPHTVSDGNSNNPWGGLEGYDG